MKLVAKRTPLLLVIGMFVLCSLPCIGGAYSYSGYRWYGTSININSDSWPSAWLSALGTSMATWNNAGSSFRFYYGSSSHVFTTGNPGAGYIALTSYTAFWWLTDVDTVFNTTYYSFATDGSANKYDVQNVATHELGHWLLLHDVYGGGDTEKTMYYNTELGETKKRTLDTDDANGIKYIYP